VSASKLLPEFRAVVDIMPPDLFARFLLSLSSCSEAFLVLRSRLLHSFSVMAVSQWVLGIGDRHTDNFLLDVESGRLAAIDFGMAFGQGQLLRIPELMPLRFTPQFQHISAPLDTQQLVAVDMEMVMDAYHTQQQRILTMLDVFVKEPHIEWIEQARSRDSRRRQQLRADQQQQQQAVSSSSASSSAPMPGSSVDPSLSWYPREKLLIARAKLNSANPAAITALEINDNALFTVTGKAAMKEACVAIIEGKEMGSTRSTVGKYCSGVREQVQCLIEQATDLNILGRTYVGWTFETQPHSPRAGRRPSVFGPSPRHSPHLLPPSACACVCSPFW
jgi:DNA-dependent protein kinase catalytic subunit